MYRIERASVRFDGPIDPVLDVKLIKDLPQLTMFVEVRGRASKPDLHLTSRPATYTEGQLLTFLIGGSPGADPGSEVRDAASGVASALVSQKVGGYIEDYLPVQVDVLRYEAATASSGAAFTVGKWVTRRLFVAFRRRLEARTDQNAGEAELEYWLAPDILIEATTGDRGHHDADLLWLKRW
jgi:translocation and assembly module TamB